MRYPNQKKVIIHKSACDNKSESNYYAKINLSAIDEAAKDLKPSTFCIWIYIAKNNENYKNFNLSMKDVCIWCNISENTYRSCIEELIKKNYLIQEGNSNNYHFYDKPQAATAAAGKGFNF